MKYRYINPEVIVQKVTKEILASTRTYLTNGQSTQEGDYLVTFPDKTTSIFTEKELNSKFKPSPSVVDAGKEMYRLCTEIIDQETMIDDDNAEQLLLEAVEAARKLRKLIH